MKILVLTNESLKDELLSNGFTREVELIWITKISEFKNYAEADVFIDLLFELDHINVLQQLRGLKIINSVEHTLSETDLSFVRINGWPTFLSSSLIEASAKEELKLKTEEIFFLFNKKIEWLHDVRGFITPRIISMIINEAFISLEENVSTKEQINIAMKLGTNYPYGPFEWSEKIGLEKISSLLSRLSKDQTRYNPSSLLFPHESV